jgi:hypothetical protein
LMYADGLDQPGLVELLQPCLAHLRDVDHGERWDVDVRHRADGGRHIVVDVENLAVDFDHNYDLEKNLFFTWCPVQDLVLRSLQRRQRPSRGIKRTRRRRQQRRGQRPSSLQSPPQVPATTMTTRERGKEDATTTTRRLTQLGHRTHCTRVFSRPLGLHKGCRGVLLVFLDSTC